MLAGHQKSQSQKKAIKKARAKKLHDRLLRAKKKTIRRFSGRRGILQNHGSSATRD